MLVRTVGKKALHLVSRTRSFYHAELRKLGPWAAGKRVLEIGSGRQVRGKEHYSAIHLFGDAEEFRQTDMNADHGHEVLDVTSMDLVSSYDLILCLNVLEHVFEYQQAIDNLHRAVRSGGIVVVAVPFAFPLHDEPQDFWRFTEHALRATLRQFSDVSVSHNGARICPFGYFVVARK
ncbi:MAG: methyltransferase domain-containing protein [Planctomycetota bacterium]